jgi:chromosome partitioning protein
MFYTIRKTAALFSTPGQPPLSEENLERLIKEVGGPSSRRGRGGLGWDTMALPSIGAGIGFLRPPQRHLVLSTFVTKGGSLKTTLCLNLARMLALHRIRTLVIGLDLQGDVTNGLSQSSPSDGGDLADALKHLDQTQGLYDYFKGRAGLEDLIQHSDLPELDYIPETPELIALDQELLLKPRREFWLRDKVIAPFLKDYEVVLLDCSPNWNQLTTNALTACDTLIAPIECRIHNYRNLRLFRALLAQCREELDLHFLTRFVPTRLNANRTLSRQIYDWYVQSVPDCLSSAIPESVHGEEAAALHVSVPEFAPGTVTSDQMKEIIFQIWNLALSRRQEIKSAIREVEAWPSI